MRAIVNLKNEPDLRDEFQYAHVVNNTVLIDRRTRWGKPVQDRRGRFEGRSDQPAIARISGATSRRATLRWKSWRRWTGAGWPAGASRCPCHGDVLVRAAEWASGVLCGSERCVRCAAPFLLHGRIWAMPSARAIRCNLRSLALAPISASIPIASGRCAPCALRLPPPPAVAALRAGARPLGLRQRAVRSGPGTVSSLASLPAGRTTSRPSAPARSRSALPSSAAKRLAPLGGREKRTPT